VERLNTVAVEAQAVAPTQILEAVVQSSEAVVEAEVATQEELRAAIATVLVGQMGLLEQIENLVVVVAEVGVRPQEAMVAQAEFPLEEVEVVRCQVELVA
jgi:hypothetical protein